jgi:hypothetical protein
MRLSFVIRTINACFARVVYVRDGLDERLEYAIESEKNWVGFMSVFASLRVMVSRAVLWVFMMLGHGISAFLMRQMEFDADAVETQLAGSCAFKSTTRKLVTRAATRRLVDQQIGEIWHFHHDLPDNLPMLLEHRMRSLPEEVAIATDAELRNGKSRWSATHPTSRDRMQRAERMQCSGAQLSETPARELFRDFHDLCRAVTVGHYHNLGVPQGIDRLMPVGVLLGDTAALRAQVRPAAPVQHTNIPFQFRGPGSKAAPGGRDYCNRGRFLNSGAFLGACRGHLSVSLRRCRFGREHIDGRRFDRNDLERPGALIGIQAHRFADAMAEQRLTERRLIRNDLLLGIAIPCAENCVGLFLPRRRLAQPHGRADRHL